MMLLEVSNNPKRDFLYKFGKTAWYEYYAGYSPRFVKNILDILNLQEGDIILDPWNGSGTTTQVAAENKYYSIGFDINPIMVIVSKARCVNRNSIPKLLMICEKIIKKAKYYRKYPWISPEPLEIWLTPKSAKVFRNIERAIQQIACDKDEYLIIFYEESLESINSVAAFFYVALFRALKKFLEKFRSSNPTWIKKPKSPEERVDLKKEDIFREFQYQVEFMINQFEHESDSYVDLERLTKIDIASSDNIPLKDNEIDAVITSPPYCTRIDYAVLTSLELALIGCPIEEMEKLRKRMIGSPVINESIPTLNSNWGKTCLETLSKINSHNSKASKTYYYKTYLQYFDSIYKSIVEINRVLKRNGYGVFVVQDSYYKDVHVNLPQIIIEMTKGLGWTQCCKEDFESKVSMAEINPKIRKYRVNTKSVESVIIFKKTRG